MDLKSEFKTQDEISWVKCLEKNFSSNRQLDFTGQMFLSCSNQSSGEIDCDMLRLNKLDKESGALLFAVDCRSDFYSNVQRSKNGCVTVYFPLSKEKLKLLGEMTSIGSLVAENQGVIFSDEQQSQIRQEIWDKLSSEEKKCFKSVKPDAIQGVNDELNTFNNPEVGNIAENFAVVIVSPSKGRNSESALIILVEHTLYTMPQVVADKRTPEFESLFKPYKKNKKYIHTKGTDGSWSVKAVNSW